MPKPAANPAAAYRRVALDARIEGCAPEKLAPICLEAAVEALGQAQAAAMRRDAPARTEAIARTLSIVAGLRQSVDSSSPASAALDDFYGGATALLRALLAEHDGCALDGLRADLLDVAAALSAVPLRQDAA